MTSEKKRHRRDPLHVHTDEEIAELRDPSSDTLNQSHKQSQSQNPDPHIWRTRCRPEDFESMDQKHRESNVYSNVQSGREQRRGPENRARGQCQIIRAKG